MKETDKTWYQALACACAYIQRTHGESTLAVDLFNELGLSKEKIKIACVEEYDIKAIKEAFGDKWEKME